MRHLVSNRNQPPDCPLTGLYIQRAFRGDTPADTMSAILKRRARRAVGNGAQCSSGIGTEGAVLSGEKSGTAFSVGGRSGVQSGSADGRFRGWKDERADGDRRDGGRRDGERRDDRVEKRSCVAQQTVWTGRCAWAGGDAVSYTHLTLPTIYSV